MNIEKRSARYRARTGLALVALAAMPLLAGCDLDKILEAEDPFTVTPNTARDTTNLETLYAGARAQLGLGYVGQQNRYGGIILASGLISDELYAADNFNTRRDLDRRDIDYDLSNVETDDAFLELQRARAEALSAISIYESSPRSGSARHAELYNIAGYAVVMLAENYCSGVPLSRITENAVEFGEPMTTGELYTLALEYFDQALAQPNGGAAQANFARVGRARTLLDMGQFGQAAQEAASVPSAFEFDLEFNAAGFESPNAVYSFINDENRMSASLQEGTENLGLNFGAAAATDPRITIADTPSQSNSGEVDVWYQLKYPSLSASVPVASGIEARLIEAEAALAMGSSAAYLTMLNDLRAGIGLAPLTDPGTPNGRVDQFFAERAYWLWLTGHRFSDMRRLIRQYGRDQAAVFPTGRTPYEETYESDVSFPIPFEEVNNPNFTGCLSTEA